MARSSFVSDIPRPPHDLLSVFEAAKDDRWPFGERFLRRLVAERRIPIFKVGRRVYLSAAHLDGLIAQGYRPGGGTA